MVELVQHILMLIIATTRKMVATKPG